MELLKAQQSFLDPSVKEFVFIWWALQFSRVIRESHHLHQGYDGIYRVSGHIQNLIRLKGLFILEKRVMSLNDPHRVINQVLAHQAILLVV